MEYLLLVLNDFSYPYLDRMLVDIKLSGKEIIPVLACDTSGIEEKIKNGTIKKSGVLVLTDSDEGLKLSRKHGMACVLYEKGVQADFDTSEAVCIIQGFDEIDTVFLERMYERYNNIPWTILGTGRLILREMTVSDVDRMYEIYSDPSMTRFMEPLYSDRLEEIEYTKAYIKNQYGFYGYGLWLVVRKEDGRIIGKAGITNREGFPEPELGYLIEKSMQGRGYAAESCRAVVEYAKDTLGIKALNCFVYPGNEASVKLCKLVGFRYKEDVCIGGDCLNRYYLEL